jgi:hypothetical protein
MIEELLLDELPLAFTNRSTTPLRIAPGRHRFEFHYTGLSFTASDKIQFKHRLLGWENE